MDHLDHQAEQDPGDQREYQVFLEEVESMDHLDEEDQEDQPEREENQEVLVVLVLQEDQDDRGLLGIADPTGRREVLALLADQDPGGPEVQQDHQEHPAWWAEPEPTAGRVQGDQQDLSESLENQVRSVLQAPRADQGSGERLGSEDLQVHQEWKDHQEERDQEDRVVRAENREREVLREPTAIKGFWDQPDPVDHLVPPEPLVWKALLDHQDHVAGPDPEGLPVPEAAWEQLVVLGEQDLEDPGESRVL